MRHCANGLWLCFGLCMLLAAGTALGAGQWVPLDGGAAAEPTVQVLNHDMTQTTLQLTLHGFWVEETSQAGETFQVLSLGDWGTTQDVGAPELPILVKGVGMPARSDLRVRVSEVQYVTLPNYRVYPFQTPTTDDVVQMPPFVLDETAYSKDGLYPAEIATVSPPQVWRDVRLTELHLNPLRYNPVRRELNVVKSCVVTIEYFGVNTYHALDHDPSRVLPPYAQMYRSALINYDWMGIDDHGTDNPGTKYLFVMKTEAQSHVQSLIDFRNAQGYKAEVKLFPSTGFTRDTDIKNYINQLYNTAGLEFVLIVGDAYYSGGPSEVDVPMHWWNDSYSDMWYACLQGDADYYPDLAIGRIVYDNMTELDHQLDKIMHYLTAPNTTSNWAQNSLLVAHQEQYPLKYTQCKEEIRTFAYALQIPTFGTAYGGAGATNDQVINYINTSGTGLLNYRGHGSDTEWWQWGPSGSFTAAQVSRLTNTDKYFVHFDVCCDNMNIVSYAGDCLAESFMKAPAAAIAINSAIIPSYTVPNHTYDKEFYKALFNNGLWRIGYASNYANVIEVQLHGSLGMTNFRTYLWLGDAATDLWTSTPQPLAMNYQTTYNLALQDFAVTVTKAGAPVANALVCAQSSTAYARGYTDASGVATLTFLEYPAASTTVTLTATAHNGLAATGTCTIIPTALPYNLVVDINPTSSTNIPASGGSFNFTLDIWNNESFTIPAMVWTDWIYPNSTIHAPFINRYIALTPGMHINRSLRQTVAGSEPAGTYTFRACVGTYQGGAIFAFDSFDFIKSGADNRIGPSVEASATLGWDDNVAMDAIALPQSFSLTQHPNPFNPTTTLEFLLPQASLVHLAVYDLNGRLVTTLADGYRAAGVHKVTFDGTGLASGIYVYRLEAGTFTASGKMVLMK